MTVLVNHARMVEIVQIKWIISIVIVSPDMQAKTVQSVSKITYIIDFSKPSQLFSWFFSLVSLLFVFYLLFFWRLNIKSFLYLIFCVQFNYSVRVT